MEYTIGQKVRVNTGRHAGECGTVMTISGTELYVDFGRKIYVNEGFGSMDSYQDGYWVSSTAVEAE